MRSSTTPSLRTCGVGPVQARRPAARTMPSSVVGVAESISLTHTPVTARGWRPHCSVRPSPCAACIASHPRWWAARFGRNSANRYSIAGGSRHPAVRKLLVVRSPSAARRSPYRPPGHRVCRARLLLTARGPPKATWPRHRPGWRADSSVPERRPALRCRPCRPSVLPARPRPATSSRQWESPVALPG